MAQCRSGDSLKGWIDKAMKRPVARRECTRPIRDICLYRQKQGLVCCRGGGGIGIYGSINGLSGFRDPLMRSSLVTATRGSRHQKSLYRSRFWFFCFTCSTRYRGPGQRRQNIVGNVVDLVKSLIEEHSLSDYDHLVCMSIVRSGPPSPIMLYTSIHLPFPVVGDVRNRQGYEALLARKSKYDIGFSPGLDSVSKGTGLKKRHQLKRLKVNTAATSDFPRLIAALCLTLECSYRPAQRSLSVCCYDSCLMSSPAALQVVYRSAIVVPAMKNSC